MAEAEAADVGQQAEADPAALREEGSSSRRSSGPWFALRGATKNLPGPAMTTAVDK
jgi:hypothetical protein